MNKTRVAIISDIHGNLEALKAVLEDIKSKNIDKIMCLGDTIAKGIHSKECLDLVRKNCDVVLRGNCDRHYSKETENEGDSEILKKRFKWNSEMLNKEDKAYLQALPYSYEFYMSGSLVRLFHASPKNDKEIVLNWYDFEKKFKMFEPTENTLTQEIADYVIYGHIHQPFMDVIYNRTLINVGSVGNSFNTVRNPNKDADVREITNANYLILTGEYGAKEYSSGISYEFVKVPYDIDKELENEEINIEKEEYRLELKKGIYREPEKLIKGFIENGIDVNKI